MDHLQNALAKARHIFHIFRLPYISPDQRTDNATCCCVWGVPHVGFGGQAWEAFVNVWSLKHVAILWLVVTCLDAEGGGWKDDAKLKVGKNSLKNYLRPRRDALLSFLWELPFLFLRACSRLGAYSGTSYQHIPRLFFMQKQTYI